MTLSVPSFLAAAMSALIPPPAAADVAVAHFLSLEDDPDGDDEQPAAASASTATPASAYFTDRPGLMTTTTPPCKPATRGSRSRTRRGHAGGGDTRPARERAVIAVMLVEPASECQEPAGTARAAPAALANMTHRS